MKMAVLMMMSFFNGAAGDDSKMMAEVCGLCYFFSSAGRCSFE